MADRNNKKGQIDSPEESGVSKKNDISAATLDSIYNVLQGQLQLQATVDCLTQKTDKMSGDLVEVKQKVSNLDRIERDVRVALKTVLWILGVSASIYGLIASWSSVSSFFANFTV